MDWEDKKVTNLQRIPSQAPNRPPGSTPDTPNRPPRDTQMDFKETTRKSSRALLRTIWTTISRVVMTPVVKVVLGFGFHVKGWRDITCHSGSQTRHDGLRFGGQVQGDPGRQFLRSAEAFPHENAAVCVNEHGFLAPGTSTVPVTWCTRLVVLGDQTGGGSHVCIEANRLSPSD